MCTATSTVSDSRVENNDYFKRRVLGFKAEIEFPDYLSSRDSNYKYIEGGQFISTRLSGRKDDKNSFIYTTVSDKEPDNFLEIYQTITSWREINELFYIRIMPTDWTVDDLEVKELRGSNKKKKKILIPDYTFYRYDKKKYIFSECDDQNFNCILKFFSKPTRKPSVFPLRKREQFNYFNDYDLSVMRNIYANRYFLDVILRQASSRQIIDVDGFLKIKSDIHLVEIKEKSPITNNSIDSMKWQYGWDSRRLLWFLYLHKHLGLKVIYCIRQIEERTIRNFIKWDCINLDTFLSGVSWSNSRSGGGGEDTLIAPYLYFTDLNQAI